jgi:alkylated DNA nucleotide flippase Atl1
MASSPSFERIQRDVLKLCPTIPVGRVCTYADVGAVIDVPARHVAYIVSRLSAATRAQYPVHRLVGHGGKLPSKPADVASLLTQDGVAVAHGVVMAPPSVRYVPDAAAVQSAKLERTTRAPEHTRGAASRGGYFARKPWHRAAMRCTGMAYQVNPPPQGLNLACQKQGLCNVRVGGLRRVLGQQPV